MSQVAKLCLPVPVAVLALVCCHIPVQADIVLTSVGVAVVEDFNNFRGDGFAPAPGSTQLDSNTYRAVGFSDGDGFFGGTHVTGDFARGASTGGVTTGGAYAFEIATGDFALGVQPTGNDFTPGNLTVRVSNQTGRSISGFVFKGDGYFFNDQDRSTRWQFQFSLDDSIYFTGQTIDSVEAADPNPIWERVPVDISSTFLFGRVVPDGGQFYLRISGDDLAGIGSRDEFAIDNFSVTAVPEPGGIVATLIIFAFLLLGRRRIRTTVSAG